MLEYIGLIFECPYKNELNTCPFKCIRTLPIKERVEVYKKMPIEQKSDLIMWHFRCSNNN